MKWHNQAELDSLFKFFKGCKTPTTWRELFCYLDLWLTIRLEQTVCPTETSRKPACHQKKTIITQLNLLLRLEYNMLSTFLATPEAHPSLFSETLEWRWRRAFWNLVGQWNVVAKHSSGQEVSFESQESHQMVRLVLNPWHLSTLLLSLTEISWSFGPIYSLLTAS